MQKKKKIWKEISLFLVTFISGGFSVFAAAIIIDGFGLEYPGLLFLIFTGILTIVLFLAQFLTLGILLGMLPIFSFLRHSIYEHFHEDLKGLKKDSSKIKELKKTIKIK